METMTNPLQTLAFLALHQSRGLSREFVKADVLHLASPVPVRFFSVTRCLHITTYARSKIKRCVCVMMMISNRSKYKIKTEVSGCILTHTHTHIYYTIKPALHVVSQTVYAHPQGI